MAVVSSLRLLEDELYRVPVEVCDGSIETAAVVIAIVWRATRPTTGIESPGIAVPYSWATVCGEGYVRGRYFGSVVSHF